VADVGRRPIGGAASKPVFGCFAVVIDGGGLPDECGPVIETVDVLITARAPAGMRLCRPKSLLIDNTRVG
jgi:hypothetical protein